MSASAAERAIKEFDGANAAGQPIRLTLLPTGPSNDSRRDGPVSTRNPFDSVTRPGRSLFERVEAPDYRRSARSRSRSPGPAKRSNVAKPPPDGVDRYVPGDRSHSWRRRSRSRSPRNRRRSPARRGRGAPRRDEAGHRLVGGRPRKTQEELDQEMDDYFVKKGDTTPASTDLQLNSKATIPDDEDIDMIS